MIKNNIEIDDVKSNLVEDNKLLYIQGTIFSWILTRVGCKNAGACECILKQMCANIH